MLIAAEIHTKAKASTPENVPAFVEKFANCPNISAYCAALREQGYTHFLNLHPGRVTIGDLDYEYRILSAGAFFKNKPPSIEVLNAGVYEGEIPVIEQRKAYSQMSSVGRGDFAGTLTGTELRDWISFFEAEAGRIRNIDVFIGD